MSLAEGTLLGPYKIVGQIGAGGMGEVYKAKDTRLDRTVAIKVLPSHLAENPDLKRRFEREARAVSSLNHPHICTLYDIGEQDGTDFIVMEYIEGVSLADRLKKGALPLDQALRHGIEIADALDKAHRQGVVHRDLKPGNIMLTKSGAKLLDFGLAKLKSSEPGQEASVLSALPTEEKPLTEKGSILGTFQYMAPEQLEGKDADAQTDIFAFGTVLYEMVTGKRAFEGKSQASLISAIMSSQPRPISELQPLAPAPLERTIKKSVAKEPEDRWQSAKDLHDELKWIAESGSQVNEVGVRPPSRSRMVWGIVAGLMAGTVFTGIAVRSLMRSTDKSSLRYHVELSLREELSQDYRTPVLALSPDGTRLAYIAAVDAGDIASTGGQLYIRELDRLEATPLSGTEGASGPSFSPDGEWVAFFADGKLKKVSVFGGAPITLCNVVAPSGASWGTGDIIVFSEGKGLFQVPATGGTPESLMAAGEEERVRYPHLLPNGKAVLFISLDPQANYDDATIEVVSLGTGERQVVHEGGNQPRYVSTGHLVFVRQGTLFGARFDLERQETTAPPTPLIERVLLAQSSGTGSAQFAFSESGTLVYLSGVDVADDYTLVWVDREGTPSPLSEQKGDILTPRFSPDGRRLAFSLREGGRDIWIHEFERETMTRWTFESGRDWFPVWSPDGEHLAFSTIRGGRSIPFWKRADGTGKAERLTESDNGQWINTWSPDSKNLVLSELDRETKWDLWVLPLDDKREPRVILRTPFDEINARFSSDGRWLAFGSNESGRYEVYVQPFPGPGGKQRISTDGGIQPLWGPGGGELFYRRNDSMMAVPYAVEDDTFRADKPRELFHGRFRLIEGWPTADIAPDGKGFVMVQSAASEEGETEPPKMVIVTNWFEELKRLIPTEN